MTPNYVAKISKISAVKVTTVLFFFLIIPIITMIVRLIKAIYTTIEFYDDKIVQKTGVFSKREINSAFTPVLAVSVHQPLLGRIFKYGDVRIDMLGKWNINAYYVAKPRNLQEFLQEHITNTSAQDTILTGAF